MNYYLRKPYVHRNFVSMRRRSSLIAGVPGDSLQGRVESSSSSSGGNAKEEDMRHLMVATPPQLKRPANDNDHMSFGLITNGKPIKRVNNNIAKPRSRRSSLASSDSPRLVTTPGRRNSMTPRSRRNSLVPPENKMDRRRLSLSLVLEKAYDDKENPRVMALISPQINKNEINNLKSSLMTSDLREINKTSPSNSASTGIDINAGKKDQTVFIGTPLRILSPLSPGHKLMG